MEKILSSGIILISAVTVFSAERQENKRPNIVFLLADDLRWNSLGCMGNSLLITPNIDQLSREGVRFTNACVTTSICMVSRATLLTGQYMSRHGITAFGKALPENAFNNTYPSVLRKAGYWTGYVGKYGVGKIRENDFDYSIEYEGKHWWPEKDGDSIHVTARNQRDALDFLNKRPKDKPFCLTVGFFATHAEDKHPDQYRYQNSSEKYYKDDVIPVSKTATENHFRALPPFLSNEQNEGRKRWHWRFDTPEKYQHYMKAYYRMLTEMDLACGRIISELKSQGVYENTVIIFMGDNGYFHGEHGLADKWYPYQESLKVPLIIRDPRIPEAKRSSTNDEFVLNIDIAPTILSAAGEKIPSVMQGRDFSVLYLSKKAVQWRKEFYYEHPVVLNMKRIPASEALVTHTEKYIYWPNYNFEEYFNLVRDPFEENNEINLPENSKSVSKLKNLFYQLKALAK
jgi:arylsulfatase A-like enzyme